MNRVTQTTQRWLTAATEVQAKWKYRRTVAKNAVVAERLKP